MRVLRAGVCATDLALLRGYMGFRGVPGHEFVGVALDGPHAGCRVVGEINAACGACPTCRAGRRRHCPHRDVLGILGRPGAFADELSLPHENLHPVPEGVSDDAATFTEPLAAAFEIAEQVPLGTIGRALVLGDGRLGLLCAWALAACGVRRVEVSGRHPERAELLPAGCTWLAGEELTGRPWDLVVEATGDPTVLARALTLVRPLGTVVLKTTSEVAAPLDLAPLVVDEVRLIGSRCGPFEVALAALADGRVRVEPLVEERYDLSAAEHALERAADGRLKVLLDVSDPPSPTTTTS